MPTGGGVTSAGVGWPGGATVGIPAEEGGRWKEQSEGNGQWRREKFTSPFARVSRNIRVLYLDRCALDSLKEILISRVFSPKDQLYKSLPITGKEDNKVFPL